ncbi:MAG TPA: hypothetical protein VKT72_08285 [Candidatus Baltobacteraceae bacterium]|nr:hypothetical protein [Candidatus Baltobacteraceae bacterium]
MMSDGKIPGSDAGQAAIYQNGTLSLLALDPNCQPGTTTATSVNALGQAVGYCNRGTRVEEALYFANGTVRELRRPGPWQQWGFLEPWAINDAGEIYGGAYYWGQSSGPDLARFFANGEPTEVFRPPVGYALNVFLSNTGNFAYFDYVYPDQAYAAVGDGSKVRRLFPQQQLASASLGINEDDYVVGYRYITESKVKTFIHSPGGSTILVPFPPGITSMVPIGINDALQVVGTACGPNKCKIFLYSNGAITDLDDSISPKGNYQVNSPFAGLSDKGAFLVWDSSQHNYAVVEPVKP